MKKLTSKLVAGAVKGLVVALGVAPVAIVAGCVAQLCGAEQPAVWASLAVSVVLLGTCK